MNLHTKCLATGILALTMLSCNSESAPTNPPNSTILPSKEVQQILRLFIAADTLNNHPKFYAAHIGRDSAASIGQVSIYLLDVYNSNGEIKSLPLTTWKIDKKIVFVFTGLEVIATGGDTTYHHLIRKTARVNKGKMWSPPFRCWRIDVQDHKVFRIRKGVPFNAVPGVIPFSLSTTPPPPIILPLHD